MQLSIDHRDGRITFRSDALSAPKEFTKPDEALGFAATLLGKGQLLPALLLFEQIVMHANGARLLDAPMKMFLDKAASSKLPGALYLVAEAIRASGNPAWQRMFEETLGYNAAAIEKLDQ